MSRILRDPAWSGRLDHFLHFSASNRDSRSTRRAPECATAAMKLTQYFATIRSRPDRAIIRDEWISRVVADPEAEEAQPDGRIRRWRRIPEMQNRYLRVILLADGETVHNAFFDRGYRP
jgi:hypothetical protein